MSRTGIIVMAIILLVAGNACKSHKHVVATPPAKETRKSPSAEELKAAEQRRVRSELQNNFANITGASRADEADRYISNMVASFTSPDAPVLIIISKSGKEVDYDRPTTIQKYLEYLKDTKNNMAEIEQISFDKSNRISELILIKK